MSTVTAMNPKEIRTQVQRRLDSATDEEVADIHRILLEMEAERLWKESGAGFAADWQSGRLSVDKIEAAVQAHRSKVAKI